MTRYDIAIIGTGPAGISAAITAKIRGKSIILLGPKNLSDKITRAAKIENYTALPNISGKELAGHMLLHLKTLDIQITDKRVKTVYAMGKYFVLEAGEDMIESNSVIVAAGVMQGKMLKGEKELLGSGVSYCATCDARLYRGKKVAVIGYSDESANEAEFLSDIASEVMFFPMKKGIEPESRKNITVIREIPREITGEGFVKGVLTDNGEYGADGVFVLRDSVLPDTLVPGLETEQNHIKADLQMKTNLDGVFACGDIVGKPYQYIKAAGQGNTAALSAVEYLSRLKNNS